MQKVIVPQQDGEIVVVRAGSDPVIYPVRDCSVTVEDGEVDGFLRQVPGSQISAGNPSPHKEA